MFIPRAEYDVVKEGGGQEKGEPPPAGCHVVSMIGGLFDLDLSAHSLTSPNSPSASLRIHIRIRITLTL